MRPIIFPTSMRRSLPTMLAIPLLLLTAGATDASKLYRWVDENGRVTFQDRPPPTGIVSFDEKALTTPQAAATPEQANPATVVVYRIDDCEPCDAMEQYLTEKGLRIERRDPDKDAEVAKEMVESFGKAEVPVAVVGTDVVRGHNVPWLEATLIKAGYVEASDASDSQQTPVTDQETAPGT